MGSLNGYASNDLLPADVRAALPEGAQDIYREAYNNAIFNGARLFPASQEAWGNVRMFYHQDASGAWLPGVE